MKKILIVNNNLLIGGIQKALIPFIDELCKEYEVTLFLFCKVGPLIEQIPAKVEVVETSSAYKYLGKRQALWDLSSKIKRGILVLLTRIFGFRVSAALLNATTKKNELPEEYDLAISYMQNSSRRSFYGGTVNYVLSNVKAKRKICFIHCDYFQSGTAYSYNNELYRKFDKIVCVSDSVKDRFNMVLPEMSERTAGIYNVVNANKIQDLAKEEPMEYDKSFVNFLSVARLSPEKGLDRAIIAFSKMERKNFRYYIIGDGNQRPKLEELIRSVGLEENVFLLGETDNPYRYMVGADWLLVPSYHEAAPVVFQEAVILHLPIITTETASAKEMVGEKFGLVVDNSEDGLRYGIERAFNELSKYSEMSKSFQYDTNSFRAKFKNVLEE